MKLRRKEIRLITWFGGYRSCRYCGYSGGRWSDSGECPSCGEVN